jgi:hypothetical protein
MSAALTREEFTDEFNRIMRNHGDCSAPDHPLWEAEKFTERQIKCQHFVCIKPIVQQDWKKAEYWHWVNTTLQGDITCYSSDDREQEEWWGFTNEADIAIWMLKWAK